MSREHIAATPEISKYVQAVSLREPPVLARLREETSRLPMAEMQIMPEQGQFMALLARATGARRALEIGVFTGYSSISIALALPPDGLLVACDSSEEWTAIARRYWKEAGVEAKIDLRLGPALDTLDHLLAGGGAGTFDLAFIDADKENYWNYYDRALQLLRPRGLILVDNVLWSGKVLDASVEDAGTRAIRAFNERLRDDERVWTSMLPISDGLTLIVKK